MMRRSKVVLFAVVFFIAGVGVSVFLRMHGGMTGDGDHSMHGDSSVRFDLWQAVFKRPDGEAVMLNDLFRERQYLLINFWASWCVPCLKEMPLLNEVAAVEDTQAAIVGISYETAEDIAPFLTKMDIDYDILLASTDIFYFFQEHNNRAGVLPFTVLVNRDGEILRQKIGDFKTAEEVAEFINEG